MDITKLNNAHKIEGETMNVKDLGEYTKESYNNKAVVIVTKQLIKGEYFTNYYLLSYDTIVARAYHTEGYYNNLYEVYGIYSKTTQRHLIDFLKYFCNVEGVNKAFLTRIATGNNEYYYNSWDYLNKEERKAYNKSRIKRLETDLKLQDFIINECYS